MEPAELVPKDYPALCEVCGEPPFSDVTMPLVCVSCRRIAFTQCCIDDVGGLCVECATDD